MAMTASATTALMASLLMSCSLQERASADCFAGLMELGVLDELVPLDLRQVDVVELVAVLAEGDAVHDAERVSDQIQPVLRVSLVRFPQLQLAVEVVFYVIADRPHCCFLPTS